MIRNYQVRFLEGLVAVMQLRLLGEHRMFCHITANWRAVPLETREVVVELISHTTTSKGLAIRAELDTNTYKKGRTVTKKELDGLALTRKEFHGEWNYTIAPRAYTL